jgi:hypothetical protein
MTTPITPQNLNIADLDPVAFRHLVLSVQLANVFNQILGSLCLSLGHPLELGDVADVMSRTYVALCTLHAELTTPTEGASA